MIFYRNVCRRCKTVSYTRVKISLIIVLTLCLTYQYCVRKSLDVSTIYLKSNVVVGSTTNWTLLEFKWPHANITGLGWSVSDIVVLRYSSYVGYVLAYPIVGMISDLHGGKLMLTIGLLLDVALCLTLLFIIKTSPWWALVFTLFSFGIAESMVLAPMNCLLAYWITNYEITKLSSAIHTGRYFAVIVTLQLISHDRSGKPWRLLLTGLSVIGVILYFIVLFTTFSSHWFHPCIKQGTKAVGELIAGNKFPKRIPWKSIFLDEGIRSVWLGMISHQWILFLLLFHFQVFQVHEISDVMTWLIQLPHLGGILGILITGLVAKNIINKHKIPVVYVRVISNFGGTIVCILIATIASYVPNLYLSLSTYSIAFFFMGMGFTGSSVNIHDLTRHYSGTIMGIANSMASFLEILYIITRPVEFLENRNVLWKKELWLSVFICLSCTVLSLIWIHSEKAPWDTIVEEEYEFEDDDG